MEADGKENAILAGLQRIEERLTSLEERVLPVLKVAEEVPGLVGLATDRLDEFGAKSGDLDERFLGLVKAAETFTQPAVLQQLLALADLAKNAPASIAMVTDIIDGVVAQSSKQGVRMDGVAHNAGASLVALLRVLQDPAIGDLLRSGKLESLAAGMLSGLTNEPTSSAPIGIFGLMKVIKEPEIQKTIQLGLNAARGAGASMRNSKQLTSERS